MSSAFTGVFGASIAEIRPILPSDAAEVGRLHVAIWRQTYVGLMKPDFLERLNPDNSQRYWRAAAEREHSGESTSRTLVAIAPETQQVVGFGSAGPARDDPAERDTELYVLNLAASTHGTGLAAVLLDLLIDRSPAYLWVVDGNERAQAFYRRHGFVLDGGRTPDEDAGVDDLRMVR